MTVLHLGRGTRLRRDLRFASLVLGSHASEMEEIWRGGGEEVRERDEKGRLEERKEGEGGRIEQEVLFLILYSDINLTFSSMSC